MTIIDLATGWALENGANAVEAQRLMGATLICSLPQTSKRNGFDGGIKFTA